MNCPVCQKPLAGHEGGRQCAINFDTLVAPAGWAPLAWQAKAPTDMYGARGGAVAYSEDVARVLQLPRRTPELDGTERATAIIDVMTERFARPIHKNCACARLDPDRHREEGCITRLRLVQAVTLREIAICGGALGAVGTGHGKTLIDLLTPLAYGAVGIRKCLLLVPPKLIPQLQLDYEYYGQHFKMPQIVVHGTDFVNTTTRMLDTVRLDRDAPELHVMSYSKISVKESTDWLEKVLRPQAIIADEVHKLRNITTTATGSRVARYMDANRGTRFVGLSGSLTSKKLQDMTHLAGWALRGGSPLPIDPETAADLARAVNPSDDPADPGPWMGVCAEGESFRDGFSRRIIETLGFISTSTSSIDTPLRIDERPAPPIPPRIVEYLKMGRGLLEGQSGPQRPDGEELVTALDIARNALQLACGFYYRWIFPRCTFPRDIPLVEDWRAKRGAYFREVREKLKSRDEHLDSELLCRYAAERYHGLREKHKGLPTWNSRHILDWYAVKDKVYYEKYTVWVDDFLVDDTVAWALEAPGVIWFQHGAFGERVERKSIERGAHVPLFGAGEDAKERLLGNHEKGYRGEDGSRSVLLSLKALGTGTNGLQHRFGRALIANPSSSAEGWEQPIARLHRPGQNRPAVDTFFYQHTDEMRKIVSDALKAAYYVSGLLRNPQKIIMALKLE